MTAETGTYKTSFNVYFVKDIDAVSSLRIEPDALSTVTLTVYVTLDTLSEEEVVSIEATVPFNDSRDEDKETETESPTAIYCISA